MTRTRLTLLLLLTLGWLSAQPTNDGVLARAKLASKVIHIGDQIFLDVDISAPPGTEVVGMDPALINELPGLEVVDGSKLSVVAKNPELLLQQRFLITSFDTGYVAVPPLPVVFSRDGGATDTTYTNDLLLRVMGILVDDDAELMPIKPIIEEPMNWLDLWPVYALLLGGLFSYGIYYYIDRQKAPPPPPPPPPPADFVALRSLAGLEEKKLWQQGQTKPYYSELTDILRRYLNGRFGIRAQEMTTRRITDELGQRRELDAERRKELSELLQLSDLVKFAKATPAEELHPRSLERVRAFVIATGKVTPAPSVSPESESSS